MNDKMGKSGEILVSLSNGDTIWVHHTLIEDLEKKVADYRSKLFYELYEKLKEEHQ